jgi:holo-[acyl-carrier protein] synthase
MGGSNNAEAAIGKQERDAVCALHRNHGFTSAGHQDVRFRQRLVIPAHQEVGNHHGAAVNLTQADQRLTRSSESRRDVTPGGRPGIPGLPERPLAAREQMRRDRLERQAHERVTGRSIPPLELVGWTRQYHDRVSTIIGLGIDATDIPRIAATIERYGARFIERIFTDGEIAYCMRRRTPAIHFAGRFAAKEAAMKALGTGHTQNVLWRGVEVVRGGGPPRLEFHGGARRRFDAMGAGSALITITHSDALAIAQVMLFAR